MTTAPAYRSEPLTDLLQRIESYPFRRRVNAIHLHHTWRPNHAEYRKNPLGAMQGMWRFHTEQRKFSDIAQHLTIGPDGETWIGRNWDMPPASATSFNGTYTEGPFAIEMIGDFDIGNDPFGGPQKESVLRVIAALQKRFHLALESLRFHNQMSTKTCPGTQISYDAFLQEVRSLEEPAARAFEDGDACADLRAHIVNLRDGKFSATGEFTTAPSDVDALFERSLTAALDRAQREGRKLRILLYAHGGLVDESDGVRGAAEQSTFWMNHGIYPIFFVWETGLAETLTDLVTHRLASSRGLLSDLTDTFLEYAARPAGKAVWGEMKNSADAAVQVGGGGLYFAHKLAAFCREHGHSVEIHAAGHSAGSIFHAHLLPALLREGVERIETLHFLAPAITIPLFRETLAAEIGSRIGKLTLYAMRSDLEKKDTAGPYHKSLLYLVHRSFEVPAGTGILGLEENLREDAGMRRLFGLDGMPGPAEAVFSVTANDAPAGFASQSTSHGGFDNDTATLDSIVHRILDTPETLRESASGPRKRALCVGIDAYPEPNTLQGCVADAQSWGSAFAERGFDVRYLLDVQATRAHILEALRDLIASSKSGDVVVFQYSGHGTSVPDLDGDEDDGLDEAMCPIDMETGGFLIDDDLHEVFRMIPEGVNVTCFADCCHSGTITRLYAAADGSKARSIPATAQMQEAHATFRAAIRNGAPRGPKAMREVLFAACRATEVAYETAGHGEFTARAVPVLCAGAGLLTHAEFLDRVTAAFGSAAHQHPDFDGAPGAENRTLLAPLG